MSNGVTTPIKWKNNEELDDWYKKFIESITTLCYIFDEETSCTSWYDPFILSIFSNDCNPPTSCTTSLYIKSSDSYSLLWEHLPNNQDFMGRDSLFLHNSCDLLGLLYFRSEQILPLNWLSCSLVDHFGINH